MLSAAETASSHRVLIVDDNPIILATLRTLVRRWSYDVQTAADGPAAVEAACTFQPDVVLLDIGLPGMNGYEVAEHLREHSELQNTQVVAITGYSQDEFRQRSEEAGFTAHLLKPVDPDVLQSLLGSIMAEHHGSAEGRST